MKYELNIEEINTSLSLHNIAINYINNSKTYLCGTCKFTSSSCIVDKSKLYSFPYYSYLIKYEYKFNHESCAISRKYIDYLKRKFNSNKVK